LPTWKKRFAGNTRHSTFFASDADGRAAFRAKPHTRARDDRESATGRSSRASRPLAPVPRLARAVARTWRPRRGTSRTSPPKTRATTAEPISRPRREAARAASRRTRARATRRRRRTRRRTRSLTKMTRQDRYGARLARRDTTRSRKRAARGCCFLFATFNAAFFPARCVSSRARARGASRRRASGNAARRGSTAALARTRRNLRGPSRRFARTSARSMPVRAKTPNACAPSFFALDSREPVGDWSERDRGEIFSPRFFLFHRVPFRSVMSSGVFEARFFFRHAGRAKRPKNLTSRRRSLVLLSSRRRRNRACAWTARLSRAFPATSAGAAKCAIASRRIDETCARA